MQSASTPPTLRIGTRGSPLALAQAEEVRRRLVATHGPENINVEITAFSTGGDRSQASNRPLSDFGGKGIFSKEIEDRLMAGDIDIGVHSSKDMATNLPAGLIMPIFLPREDVRDVFISLTAPGFAALPEGAVIGTSSLRRRAQIARLRPDIKLVEFRGNVGTRLQKLADGVADATFLAAAGLMRTHKMEHATEFLDTRDFPPAPGQGAIGIELRADDAITHQLVLPLNHAETAAAILAERAFLRTLDGSCRTPIAALTRHMGPQISLFGQILSVDGREMFEAEISGAAADAETIGHTLGERLLDMAGPEFIARLKAAL